MKKYSIYPIVTLLAAVSLLGCKKEADPFVDRVAAPVLVVIDNASGDGGGLTGEPVVNQKVGGPVTMAVRIYELDKTGILDNKVGIDSIPVTALAIKLTRRDGTAVADLTTDATGKATIAKTWTELGITAPRAGSSVQLTWSGEHKGQAFSRLSRVNGVN
jgi:phosphotransferase system HPr-like phosphotransfer protein